MKTVRDWKSVIHGILIIAKAVRQGQKARMTDSPEGRNYRAHRSRVI